MSREKASTSAAVKASSAVGIVAAGLLAVVANVAVARHYARWDLTTHRLYSLAPATVETLRGLRQPVRFDVLLPSSDPLATTVRFLLDAYRAESDRLDVHWADPDRSPAEFLALQQKYGIEAGRTQDGQVVVETAVVVSREGSKPYFLTSSQMIDVEGEDNRARSRVEQSITTAIRSVIDDERPRVCFTAGHGELKIEEGGPHGLADLASRLRRNNYTVESVDIARPDARGPLDGCRVAVTAGPTQPFAPDEAKRLRAWLEKGGDLLLLANPVPDAESSRTRPLGLDDVVAAGGMKLDEDLVFERDAAHKLPAGAGEVFLAEPQAHDISAALATEAGRALKILFVTGRSIGRAPGSSIAPATLLASSKESFGVVDFSAAAKHGGAIEKGPGDLAGPLPLAMASELPKPEGSSAAHGPRLVVVGAASLAEGQSWEEPALRGGAIFTMNAITWLAARPPIVDVPDKPAIAGVRIDEASLGEVRRYVLGFMPAAVALMGIAMWLRRRSIDAPTRARPADGAKPGSGS